MQEEEGEGVHQNQPQELQEQVSTRLEEEEEGEECMHSESAEVLRDEEEGEVCMQLGEEWPISKEEEEVSKEVWIRLWGEEVAGVLLLREFLLSQVEREGQQVVRGDLGEEEPIVLAEQGEQQHLASLVMAETVPSLVLEGPVGVLMLLLLPKPIGMQEEEHRRFCP